MKAQNGHAPIPGRINPRTIAYCLAGIAFATIPALAQLNIPSGTRLSVRLEQPLSSSLAQEGQTVSLSVTEDVRIDGKTVIERGSAATGTVLFAKERGRMGRAGKLDFSIDKVRAIDGTFIPLRYQRHKKAGDGKGVASGVLTGTAAIVFWPAAPFFLMMKGKDVTVDKGLTVEVFTDSDHALRPAAVQAKAPPSNPSGSAVDSTPPIARSTATDDRITVTISSDVEGAEVEIDGSFVGTTPATKRLSAGSHRILVKDSGLIWDRSVYIEQGDVLSLQVKLKTPAANLAARGGK